MRKTLLLLLVFLLLGCTKLDKDETNYYKYVDNIIKSNKKVVNHSMNGYKLYIPKGISVKKIINNNIVFNSGDTFIYFYADVISYYYNKDVKIDDEKYDYFKEIDDKGYLIVDENNENYYIKLNYNYSSIEFYSPKKDIPRLLTLSSIIINSVQFNKNIIEKELNNSYNNSEKIYEIKDLKENDNNFSKYLNEYVEEVEEKVELPD